MDNDLELARALQSQFDEEDAHEEMANFIPEQFRIGSPAKKVSRVEAPSTSIVAPEWEDLDPTPDLHALFLEFNNKFFWGKLLSCEVKWSPRMTLCAGVCSYQRRAGYCSIRLSVPLLKLRPRKDMVETLLHEMIHAFLFITDGDDDHDGHGPAFHKHMFRINKEAGTKISVYHSFHDEVALYKQHWWKCNGPCQKKPPFYGMVKRSMNRAPGPNDNWWQMHLTTCGGSYTKIKEPEGYGQKKTKGKGGSSSSLTNGTTSKDNIGKGQKDIRSFINGSASQSSSNGSTGKSSSATNGKGSTNSQPASASGGGAKGNIFGFGGTSFSSPGSSAGGLKTKGRVGTVVVGPHSRVSDNSAGGHVISSGTDSTTLSSSTLSGGNSTIQLDSSPGAVRQTLRDFWGNRFEKKDMSSSGTQQEASSVKTLIHSGPSAKCPVCAKEIPERDMNAHLDACLQSPPPDGASGQSQKNPFVDDDDSKACPVCGKEVLVQEMNDHLDFCIDANQ